jgi:hypothetical protein
MFPSYMYSPFVKYLYQCGYVQRELVCLLLPNLNVTRTQACMRCSFHFHQVTILIRLQNNQTLLVLNPVFLSEVLRGMIILSI